MHCVRQKIFFLIVIALVFWCAGIAAADNLFEDLEGFLKEKVKDTKDAVTNPKKALENTFEIAQDAVGKTVNVGKGVAGKTVKIGAHAANSTVTVAAGASKTTIQVAASATKTHIKIAAGAVDTTVEVATSAGKKPLKFAKVASDVAVDITGIKEFTVIKQAATAVEDGVDKTEERVRVTVLAVSKTAEKTITFVEKAGTKAIDLSTLPTKLLDLFMTYGGSFPPRPGKNSVEDISQPDFLISISEQVLSDAVDKLLATEPSFSLSGRGSESNFVTLKKGTIEFNQNWNTISISISDASASFEFLKDVLSVQPLIKGLTVEVFPRLVMEKGTWHLQIVTHMAYLNIETFPDWAEKTIANLIENEIRHKPIISIDVGDYLSHHLRVDSPPLKEQREIHVSMSKAILVVQGEPKALLLKAKQ
jgi:hypothetical protein